MLNEKDMCPKCGGVITYNTDDEGRLIKWCSCCGTYYIVGNNINTQDELTTAINQDKQSLYVHDIDPTTYFTISRIPQTIEITCDSITLKHNDISIRFCTDKDIKQFDSITINGVKFKRMDEE